MTDYQIARIKWPGINLEIKSKESFLARHKIAIRQLLSREESEHDREKARS
jgi:hypothetical protein